MDYQDFINYEEEAIFLIDDEESWELLEDPRYNPIIVVLRKGPMTVKDLEQAYNQYVANEIDKMPLETKEKKELKEKTKRKGKTLYKYLDQLERKGLVKQVGKRVKMEQTASETLYGRIAKLYLLSDKHKVKLNTDEIKKTIPILGKIVSLEMKKSKISLDCITDFIDKIYSLLQKERERVFMEFSKEITDVATNVYYDELQLVLQGLDFYILIKHAPELQKELEKCLKD